jgi:hypothetical protein
MRKGSGLMAAMTKAQKTMMNEFHQKLLELWEKYWNPDDSDSYWDDLTDDAMALISQFQTKNPTMNAFISNMVVAFLNSREELIM